MRAIESEEMFFFQKAFWLINKEEMVKQQITILPLNELLDHGDEQQSADANVTKQRQEGNTGSRRKKPQWPGPHSLAEKN